MCVSCSQIGFEFNLADAPIAKTELHPSPKQHTKLFPSSTQTNSRPIDHQCLQIPHPLRQINRPFLQQPFPRSHRLRPFDIPAPPTPHQSLPLQHPHKMRSASTFHLHFRQFGLHCSLRIRRFHFHFPARSLRAGSIAADVNHRQADSYSYSQTWGCFKHLGADYHDSFLRD